MQTSTQWPPTFKIKRHRRARYVKLRTSHQGLEITVPFRFNLKHLPSILEENKLWITKQLAQLPVIAPNTLPIDLTLHATGQYLQIHYHKKDKIGVSIRASDDVLTLAGNITNIALCKNKIRHWLKFQAKKHLSKQLHLLSEKTQLVFTKISIRNQRTLWGSCTKDAAISLNYKLIFLPERLVTHILLHELCHTQCLDHSSQFWRLVARHDPNWEDHKKEMKKAEQYIPAWL